VQDACNVEEKIRMDMSEFEPQENPESGEGSEEPEGQELNDATFEPLAYIEQTGGYQQAEAIQRDFSALMDASSNPLIPIEVEVILLGEESPPIDGGDKQDMTSLPKEAPGTGMDYGHEKAPGSGADDMPPERAPGTGMDYGHEKAPGSGADDMPPERAPGTGMDYGHEKAPGSGVDRPGPIIQDEPEPKEEQEMKFESDSDPSDKQKRD
jgi:hypothetical protein